MEIRKSLSFKWQEDGTVQYGQGNLEEIEVSR